MRGKGEGALYRVPKDLTKPLRFWEAKIELKRGPNGERRRLPPIRSKSKALVIERLEQAKADLKKRGDLPTKNETVEHWMTLWIEHIAPKELAPATIRGYRTVINKHILPAIGHEKLDSITPAHIRRVHDAIIAKGLTSTYALNAHRVMSSCFATAERENRMSRNVAKITKAPRKSLLELEALTIEEAIHIVEVQAREENAELGARWVASLLTGGRRGEMIGLERDRIDFGDESTGRQGKLDLSWQLVRLKLTDTPGVPVVPTDFEYRHIVGGLYFTRPKSNTSWRVIPLVEPLRSILKRYVDATPPNAYGLVWAPNNYPLDPDQDSKAWHGVLKSAGITKYVRLHDVRHTTVDMLYEAGVPEDLIMEIVGHSTRAMSRSYKSRGNQKRLGEAMNQLSAPFISPSKSE